MVAEADADAPLRDVLAAALGANERLAGLAEELRAENARLREENARVIVRVRADCRRRYRRACRCPEPATVMAPGPPKAIGKGLCTNGFTAMLFTERYVAGRARTRW